MKKRSSGVKSASYYKKKADELFSLYIRKRDGKCMYCSNTETLQCAHLEGRRNERLRFDPMNAITLCYKHHIHWAHKEPRQFAKWLEENYPANCRYIDEHARETEHRKLADYIELVESLKSMVANLGER